MAFSPMNFIKEREYGLENNPNSLGLKMVYSSLALIFFHLVRKDYFLELFFLLFLLPFLQIIFISGSRKSFLAFILLIASYIFILLFRKINIQMDLSLYFITIIIISIILYNSFF